MVFCDCNPRVERQKQWWLGLWSSMPSELKLLVHTSSWAIFTQITKWTTHEEQHQRLISSITYTYIYILYTHVIPTCIQKSLIHKCSILYKLFLKWIWIVPVLGATHVSSQLHRRLRNEDWMYVQDLLV